MRNDFISEIDGSGKGHWWPGIFAIEHSPSGKRFYVGTTNVGRRVWDNHGWLKRGAHPNSELQADWSASMEDFRTVLVERVPVKGLIPFVKQMWMDRDRLRIAAGIYNRQNAIGPDNPRLCRGDLSLPRDFLHEPPPQPPVDLLQRALDGSERSTRGSRAWDERLKRLDLHATPRGTHTKRIEAMLAAGLPSQEKDCAARADELLRRVRGLIER